MFVRTKRSVGKGGTYEYVQIVRSYRDGGRVRQQVVATLGRRDRLEASGEIDGLLRSLSRFSDGLQVVDRVRTGGLKARSAKAWGPALVFERLWQRQGVPEVLAKLLKGRHFKFDVERATFAMALQRLCCPGSDLQGSKWVRTVEAAGFEGLELQHFYRTARFLYDVRERLEDALFLSDRDLFSRELELVFLDTTSVYVYRDGETEWRKRGYSRDRRGDLPQFVLCVVVDGEGWPIAWEVLPGNTADVRAMERAISKFRERFSLRRVVVVADRGMIAKSTLRLLAEHESSPFDYVLGCRMRNDKLVRDQVLTQGGAFQPVAENLEVKDVHIGGRRFVVCLNPREAAKDAAAREALLKKLESSLAHGPKTVIKNRGFARFLVAKKGATTIDREAIAKDARYDGKFVLTTNTNLSAADVALTYKRLWRVERAFRTEKSVLDVRPIYHHSDRNSIGHIVASFLALRLEVDLQRRMDEQKVVSSWPDVMRDLSELKAVYVEADGHDYRLRTDLVGAANAALRAAGVRAPPILTPLGTLEEAVDGV